MHIVKERERRDRRGLIVLLLLLVMLPCETPAQRLPLKTYTTADGLWNSAVSYIMRDSHQFLWFCTQDGLSRFDGSRFVNYKIPTAFPTQQVVYMLETHGGVYWIISGEGQLYRYDPQATLAIGPGRGRVLNSDGRVLLSAQRMTDESFSNKSFQTLYEDSSGNLWAGYEESSGELRERGLALIKHNNETFKLQTIPLNLPRELAGGVSVSVISEGQDGSLWLGTGGGLLRLTRNRQVIRYAFGRANDSEPVSSLLLDKDGRVWLGRRSGLLVFKPGPSASSGSGTSFKFMSRRLNIHKPIMQGDRVLLPETENEAVDRTLAGGDIEKASAEHTIGSVAGIYQQSNGRIWTIVNEQLVFFADGRFHGYTGLYPAGVKSPFSEDLDGNLWIASPSGPIRVSLRGMKTYDNAAGLKKSNIHGIYEDNAGILYVVTGGGKNLWVNRLSDGRFSPIHPNVPGPSVTAFLDHAGEWWIPAERGLYRYRFSRSDRFEDLAHFSPFAIYTKTDGFSSGSGYNFEGNNAHSVFEDSEGDLWISTRNFHLVHWQRATEMFYTFTEANGWPLGELAVTFAEDKAGNLWFGTSLGDLVRYRKGRFTLFTQTDGAPGVSINGLYIDHEGRLWLASDSKGVMRMDDPGTEYPRIVSYTGDQNLLRADTNCIVEDLDGHIYIGTSGSGIDRLTLKTGDILHYGASDGLAAEYVAYAHRDHNGTLWFTTSKGLSQLDPQPDAMGGRSVTIMGLRISGSNYPMAEAGSSAIGPLELSTAENSLEIDFASIGHSGPLLYQYKFEGRDRDWTPINQPLLRFESLAPGDYHLRVRVDKPSNDYGAASVSFRILRPIWLRWWFLTAAVMLATSIVFLLYRYRLTRLLELERIRSRIAADLHDHVGSDLSSIAIQSELVKQHLDGNTGAAKSISTIAGTSRELLDSMSDLVWTINPERDRFSDLSQRMRRFASDILTASNIEFSFESQGADPSMKIGPDVRRQVFFIFKEVINNIVRHSGSTEVKIALGTKENSLTLVVNDNGKGFDPVATCDGNGLANMRMRAKQLSAALNIQSNGGGTTISLKVPLSRSRAHFA